MKNSIELFIISEMLINPIEKIITEIKEDKIRDCDIEWLNNQVVKFSNIALETLNLKFNIGRINESHVNKHIKEKFLNIFTVLLNYFKENYYSDKK